MKDKL